MSDIHLYTQISSLPADLKKEVSDFVEYLKTQTKRKRTLKERKFGYAKGFFKISDDFDEPAVRYK